MFAAENICGVFILLILLKMLNQNVTSFKEFS